MKIILILLMLCGVCYAQDRVTTTVRVEFKKFVWTCPSCGQEDITDANPAGGNIYIYTCSKCGAKFNQSGPNMKEYNGAIDYSADEYAKVDSKVVEEVKTKRCSDWLYEVKHPPAYVEPSKADYEGLYKQKIDEAKQYLDKYSEKATTEEVDSLKAATLEKIDAKEVSADTLNITDSK